MASTSRLAEQLQLQSTEGGSNDLLWTRFPMAAAAPLSLQDMVVVLDLVVNTREQECAVPIHDSGQCHVILQNYRFPLRSKNNLDFFLGKGKWRGIRTRRTIVAHCIAKGRL